MTHGWESGLAMTLDDSVLHQGGVISTPRYVTVSEIYDFLRDVWRWYAKWRLNRVPRERSQPLSVGSAVHIMYEMYFSGQALNMRLAFESQLDSLRTRAAATHGDEAAHWCAVITELKKYEPQITGFRDSYEVTKTLEVEQPFELPVGWCGAHYWTLRGRPDRVVQVGGKIWHMQNRTLAGTRNVMVYSRLLQRNMHETLYAYHLMKKYQKIGPYGGTILNIVRKMSQKQHGKKELRDISTLAFQTLVPITPSEVSRAALRLNRIVSAMEDWQKMGDELGIDALIDNPLCDGGIYGNAPDAYFEVLSGRTTLDDDHLFEARKDTYADVAAGTREE